VLFILFLIIIFLLILISLPLAVSRAGRFIFEARK
jgi:hypothetical protein